MRTDDRNYFGRPSLVVRTLDIGNLQHLFRFPNGYGASVVQGWSTYGGEQGLWELAVLSWPEANDSPDGHSLCYDTHITDDVLGWLSREEVASLLDDIRELPTNPEIERRTRDTGTTV